MRPDAARHLAPHRESSEVDGSSRSAFECKMRGAIGAFGQPGGQRSAPMGQMDHGVCSPVVARSDHGVGSGRASVYLRTYLRSHWLRQARVSRRPVPGCLPGCTAQGAPQACCWLSGTK